MEDIYAANKSIYRMAEFFDSYEYEECLRCIDEDEAIADAIDAIELADGESLCARLLKEEITIYGFRRRTIPPLVIMAEVDEFIEKINETLHEQYGDPYGDPIFDTTKTGDALYNVLKSVDHNVWACESCGHRILEGTELVDWVKKNRPDWIKD